MNVVQTENTAAMLVFGASAERLNPRARSRRSNLAHLRVVRHPVGAVIAPLVEPTAVVVEALTVALVIIHDVEVVGVDLEAPNGHGVVDADVPRCK